MNAVVTGFIGAILYGALAVCATPAAAGDLSADQIEALKAARAGDMTKLIFHDSPKPRLETTFETGDGAPVSVADYEGKVVVLDFWATWCPPCREEMPSLDRLKAAMADEGFDVVTVSMDRASTEKIQEFYDSVGVENLAIHREPSLRIGSEGAILGMPTTLILDRKGREIARLQGDAEWDGPDATGMIRSIMAALDGSES
ncbi:TlpA family protein disulfide reductase [Pikeienuella piscinae]|uniref:TlpA family protein disulfide reductase n=1 Tax=Pikeienuella piscinae TaxID=2748098 RepID=A0A7L5C0G6_9RHOB|nr:TlpA disulfide reductase family protein [Pikeienuella piscinae]QIE55644.1 TlpA family protein disulfide reductase [Pikeienuella piscinae]